VREKETRYLTPAQEEKVAKKNSRLDVCFYKVEKRENDFRVTFINYSNKSGSYII